MDHPATELPDERPRFIIGALRNMRTEADIRPDVLSHAGR
jgi:hypothetical protein